MYQVSWKEAVTIIRLIVQSCAWEFARKYPSLACLHILCDVMFFFSHLSNCPSAWKDNCDRIHPGDRERQSFSRCIFSFLSMFGSQESKKKTKQNPPDRARQASLHKQDEAICFLLLHCKLDGATLVSWRLSLTLWMVGSDTTFHLP